MAFPSQSEMLGMIFMMLSPRALEELLPFLLSATSRNDRFHGGTLLLLAEVKDEYFITSLLYRQEEYTQYFMHSQPCNTPGH